MTINPMGDPGGTQDRRRGRGRVRGNPATGGRTISRLNDLRRLDMGELTGEGRNAAVALTQLFRQYGLESLAPRIVEMVQEGVSESAIQLQLQDTPEYKRRFRGNERRRDAGLPALSPQEYLSTERSYRQVMQQYGLPKGFYDSTEDLADFIARDISPSELQGRVQVYASFANNTDEATRSALRQFGVGEGELAAHMMDPGRALPLLERQARAVRVSAAAKRQDLSVGQSRVEELTDMGVDAQQAQQGFAAISEMLPSTQNLAEIYDEDYTQRTAEREIFEGSAEARRKRTGLASQERAAFSGSSRGRVGSGSSGQSY